MTSLDLDFVRAQFPAFAEPTLQGQAFFENAGGSYACRQVTDLLGEYYRRLKVQPYYRYPAAQEAGEWMDAAYEALAPYLGVTAEHLHFGPSTSQNAYVLAQAVRPLLRAGDEIIVTDVDFDACRQGKEKMFNFAAHRRPQWYRAIIDQVGAVPPA